MEKKSLSIKLIVDTAVRLTEERGYGNFSVRELAQELQVKAASLYNHIDSIKTVNCEVAKAASAEMSRTLSEVILNKKRDEALTSLSYAFRQFIKDHYELYQAILALPQLDQSNGDDLRQIGRDSMQAIRNVLRQYRISAQNVIHLGRILRSELQGFTLFEVAGYFSIPDCPSELSFKFLVKQFISMLHQLENNSSD